MTTQTIEEPRIITAAELAKYEGADTLWLAVHGKVYNLTAYAADHPGGVDVLKDSAGTDATESFDYAGHPKSAVQSMAKFCIGRLEGSHELVAEEPKETPALKTTAAPAGKSSSDSKTRLLMPLLLVGAGASLPFLPKLAKEVSNKLPSINHLTLPSLDLGSSGSSTFLLGLAVGLGPLLAGVWALYALLCKSMDHEKNVFSYPSVIPNPRRVRVRVE
ncbi:cytochrome b5 reductase, putative [Cordyceps militaris CM01]|uniref:Cytochrome b5 reductase, putative n=1 Tax=Cordyceps militaris (strain CM01) TaxID=983644 RepID=G3J5K5_CORMM|nr:cytochrome b5 reductase, putative [Cordyceps militaris CM01]EGX96861.1 cytochrome b5 reductase, putative [Cordyceps militaris CM01]